MNPPRLLLADQLPVVREGLRDFLERRRPDWEVCGLTSTALDLITQAVTLAPDIVILGYRLPDSNGLDAAKEIARRAPEIEVLLFTGADSPYVLCQLYQSKVRGVLLKTEPLEEILFAVETIRRHHRFRSRALTEFCEKLEAGRAKYEALTPRETEVSLQLTAGYQGKEAADHKGISPQTIDSHRTRIFKKLGVHNVVELTRHAIHHGIVDATMKEPPWPNK